VLYVKDFHGNDPRFVYHLLRNFDLSRFASGTGVPTLNRNFVHDELVNVPPLPEQQRIVGILDEAFAGIATAKANAKKNLRNARELFETKLRSIFRADSDTKTLREIAVKFGRGRSTNRPRGDPKLYGGKYPFIQTGEVSNAKHFIRSYSQTYNEVGLAQSRLWPRGTVCIVIVGVNVGATAILDFDACIPDSVIGIVVNDKLADAEYVDYMLRSFRENLSALGKGTARDNLNVAMFEDREFPFPSVEVQKRVAEELNELDDETQRLESLYAQKLTALDALKKSLLHQAFTGQL
jgi:type I restriction enzyme S subunit